MNKYSIFCGRNPLDTCMQITRGVQLRVSKCPLHTSDSKYFTTWGVLVTVVPMIHLWKDHNNRYKGSLSFVASKPRWQNESLNYFTLSHILRSHLITIVFEEEFWPKELSIFLWEKSTGSGMYVQNLNTFNWDQLCMYPSCPGCKKCYVTSVWNWKLKKLWIIFLSLATCTIDGSRTLLSID